MAIGIFGGSFDPPHAGHLHVAITLRAYLGLREVWWVVTRSNLLKAESMHSFRHRISLVRDIVSGHRCMRVVELDSVRSYDVVRTLMMRHSKIKFIWLGGSDNLLTMHKWYRWQDFCGQIPIVLLERPGYVYNALSSPIAMQIPRVSSCKGICGVTHGWSIVRAKTSNMSSSRIRSDME